MRYGTLDGKIDGIWQVAYDSGTLTEATTSLTISGLNGDVDKEYELYSFVKNGYNGAQVVSIKLNNDSTANIYGVQWMAGNNTSALAERATHNRLLALSTPSALNDITWISTKIQAKSGQVRTALSQIAYEISGTTVGTVGSEAGSWNNTADNLTSIVVTASQANGIGAGSRFILLKKVDASSGMRTGILQPNEIKGCWKRVYDNTLTGAATSVTVSGLTGNTTPILRVRARIVNGYNGGIELFLRPNNDSGSNYGRQRLGGASSTVSATRHTSNTAIFLATAAALNELSQTDLVLYAKSGNVRTTVDSFSQGIAGTTINSVQVSGQSWNNTADEITSLVVLADQANGLGVGTHIEVDALII